MAVRKSLAVSLSERWAPGLRWGRRTEHDSLQGFAAAAHDCLSLGRRGRASRANSGDESPSLIALFTPVTRRADLLPAGY